jgi:ribonucleoside-diphosphate reductase alpha chain
MNSGLQFYAGITTDEIQQILVKSASDLISLELPNYQYFAARLLLFAIRKRLYGGRIDMPHLDEHINRCVQFNVYDSVVNENYSKEEINELNDYIDHDRDFIFTYAGLRQVVDKYLVQDRSDGRLYESPQFTYMMIALTGFANYPKATRLSFVKRFYDAISCHKINLPTPIIAGIRRKEANSASCVLIDVADDKESIASSAHAMIRYICEKAGIGLNGGRWRGIGSKIRGGEAITTGVIPILQFFERSLKAFHQGGIRAAAATAYFPIWHQEIESIIVLKNNKGTEENRVRKLDYNIQLSRIFLERFISDGEITLFSPHYVTDLYEAFYDSRGTDRFDELYVKYEADVSIPQKKISARKLILDLISERFETGRIYLMFVDHANSHSPFKDNIYMSNLCTEILEPTTPIYHIDDEAGEIALCTLSSFNLGIIKSDKELEGLADLTVRFLDELIDLQYYPVRAAEIATKARRMLGVGVIGLAHYLAKLNYSYEQPEAWKAVHGLSESIQYYMLKASNNLAKEKGHCEYFGRTKYADGILPIDTYKKDVDEICNEPLQHDWESLRQDILKYGLRNSTLTTILPSESCLFWGHKIKTSKGDMDFHQIAEQSGLDWKNIEENDLIGWYDFKNPLQVETKNGYKNVDKLYFNGNKEVVTLTLENGKVIKCTPNHRFLINQKDGATIWKRVYEISEGDNIVEF